MSASIARFLKDFGETEAPAMPVAQTIDIPSASIDDFQFDDFEHSIPEPTLDPEELRAAAFEEGRLAATVELTETFETERLALIESHGQELSAERGRVELEASEHLSARLTESMEQIASLFTAQAMAALAPLMTEELSRKAAVDLAELVKTSMFDGEAGKLIVKGPKPMFDAFIAALGLKEDQYQYTESSDYDLSVELDESIVVTRMSAWVSSLRKVMQ